MVMTTTGIQLPPIWCPLAGARHPRVEEIERRAVAWIDEQQVYQDESERRMVLASSSADFYARFAPYADEDGVLMAAMWVYWAFLFDDTRCDHGPLSADPGRFAQLAGRVQRALEAPTADSRGERFIPPLQDLARRMRASRSPVQVARFAHAHRAWLSGVVWQIGNRARGHMPDLDEYLAMRRLTAGGEPTYGLMEIATGTEAPDREFHRPAVRALSEMAMTVAALDNDRHSLRAELLAGHTDQNIYTVLMRHRDLAPADAVQAAVRVRDRIMARFLRLLPSALAGAGTDLRTYLEGLCHGLRGNAEWGLRTPRYSTAPPGAEEEPLEWATSPADDDPAPLPAPSMAWWWDRALE
ncbi:terpene synthase family protein [Streptomyces sp. YIM 98790]|uniref:terpene synthase family protein n=1 Tax=Streptomyces sp. YIM 98790 TaxID=2689077 RepID=UPI001A9DBF80|nr:hypothetical protein [Streptomyces sp. YIM 98790]